MKKSLLVLLFILAWTPALQTQAQIKFGVKGGLNLSEFSMSGDIVNNDNKIGFYLGPTMKISLPLTGLGLDVSALYDQRSTDISVYEGSEEVTLTTETLKQKQLAIPINLRYSIGLGSIASIYFFAGPQFAFNLADDIEDINWEWKNTYTSVNLGAGVTLIKHLQVNLNYNIGCGKTGECTVKDVAHDVFHARSSSWQLGAAWYF